MRQLLEIQKKTPFPCLLIEAEESFMVNYQRQIAEHFALQGLPVPKVYNAARLETNEIYQFLTYNPTQYASLPVSYTHLDVYKRQYQHHLTQG